MRVTSSAGRPIVSAVCPTVSTKTSAPTTNEREGEQRLGDHSHVGGSDRKRHSVKPSAASLLSYY
jgi:hypothetical protein